MISADVISVSEFINQVKGVVDQHPSFKNVALVGELSNFKAHHSGHFYFSLKDEHSRITCAMFRSRASHVNFAPKDGDKVVIIGRCEVYFDQGTLQFYVDRMNLDGLGDLYIQFEALKAQFEKMGYFSTTHKLELPAFPRDIAVIVGPKSAAYADISRTLQERWPVAMQHDLLAYVQGEHAGKSIVNQITKAHELDVDVIILGRGGGSIEDLWAFNEPAVIEAIYHSKIPIITGIGHESDTTLSDFVSDYRAATPTAAAVRATPALPEVKDTLRNYKNKFYIAVRNRYVRNTTNLNMTMKQSRLRNPIEYYERIEQKLDFLSLKLLKGIDHFERIFMICRKQESRIWNQTQVNIRKGANRCHMIEQSLLNSMKLIERKHVESYEKSLNQLRYQEVQISSAIQRNYERLDGINRRLYRSFNDVLNLKKSTFDTILKSIDYRSPFKLMMQNQSRGFVTTVVNDVIVTSVESVNIGDNVTINYRDGMVNATIKSKEKPNE